ncbi:hypothetical protein [Paludisphaera soli]|uniref:hypothetical protein n=1 Tax=Paludisphaera soli TaxID=2712865 RepID=UPI0013EE1E47|nr:hypothetical protein [Paludisphaera soli]
MSDVNRMRLLIVFQLAAVAVTGFGFRSWEYGGDVARWAEPAAVLAFLAFGASLVGFLVLLAGSSIAGPRRWLLVAVEGLIVWAGFLASLPGVQ